MVTRSSLKPTDEFLPRHLGPSEPDVQEMLAFLSLPSLAVLADATVPGDIRLRRPLGLPVNKGEQAVLAELKTLAAKNTVCRSLIGMGYYGCVTPGVIQRNILENPGWYTQYTPYQAEIAQGRLEALVNFQTMVADLTGLPLANASLLDEATAAAEAMTMSHTIARAAGDERQEFFVSHDCHPQTIAVVRTRAEPLGITIRTGTTSSINFSDSRLSGILLQYPATDGYVGDYSALIKQAHEAGVLVVVATDLLALTLLRSPGEFGADVAIGSTQRFGVPIGFGGPHAAFLAAKEEYKRQIPGRIVGVSKDITGQPACRLALQTREQHIRREKATSNICTAQVLLAVMAGMYAVYHGPEGLRWIARTVHGAAVATADILRAEGFEILTPAFFDTFSVRVDDADVALARAGAHGILLSRIDRTTVGVALDEATASDPLIGGLLAHALGCGKEGEHVVGVHGYGSPVGELEPAELRRTSPFLTHPVFN